MAINLAGEMMNYQFQKIQKKIDELIAERDSLKEKISDLEAELVALKEEEIKIPDICGAYEFDHCEGGSLECPITCPKYGEEVEVDGPGV